MTSTTATADTAEFWQHISEELDFLLVKSGHAYSDRSAEVSARQLREQLQSLKQRCTEALQSHTAQHYPLLINLHRIISNSHSVHFTVLEPKLIILQHAASTAATNLKSHVDSFAEKLHTRSKLVQKRLLLQDMLRSESLLTAAEAEVRSVPLSPSLESLSKACDIFSAYLSSKKVACSRADATSAPETDALPLFISHQNRAKTIESTILRHLDSIYDDIWRNSSVSNPPAELEAVFALYSRISRPDHIEQYICTSECAGFDFSGLKPWEVLVSLLTWIRTRVSPLVPLTSAEHYQIPLRCIWWFVQRHPIIAGTTGQASLFVSTDPEVMHRNFRAWKSVQLEIESLCRSSSELDNLRADSAWQAIDRRWNWAVYFQLRSLEALGDVVPLFASDHAVKCAIGSKYFYTVVDASHRVIAQRLLNPDPASSGMFVAPLAHRFLKLSLQVMIRLHKWFGSMWDTLSKRMVDNWDLLGPLLGDMLHFTLAFSECSSENSACLIALSPLGDDLSMTSMKASLLPLLSDALSQTARSIEQDTIFQVTEPIVSFLYESCLNLQSGSNVLAQSSSGVISAGVRSLSSQYLLASEKTAPSIASSYVKNLLQPLRAMLFTSAAWQPLSKELTKSWAGMCIDRICNHYLDAITQFVHSTSKRQEFLNRQKRGTPATIQQTSHTVSAGFKMAAQLRLDIEELEIQVSDLLGTKSFPSLQKLHSFVVDNVPQMLQDVN